MTNKQAIEVLNMIETHGSLPTKAKEMAIKALEERPTGKWIITDMKGIYRCSECKMLSYLRSYNYCQNCGSKMEVEE